MKTIIKSLDESFRKIKNKKRKREREKKENLKIYKWFMILI